MIYFSNCPFFCELLRDKGEKIQQVWRHIMAEIRRYDELPGLQQLFITVPTHVLLSLGGGHKEWAGQSLVSHPEGLETRMSHPPRGDCFYRPVTSDPSFALRLANQLRPTIAEGRKKHVEKGKQRGLILRVMQLDSWSPAVMWTLKLWGKNFISLKRGEMKGGSRDSPPPSPSFRHTLQRNSCPTLLANILRKHFSKKSPIINGPASGSFTHRSECAFASRVRRPRALSHNRTISEKPHKIEGKSPSDFSHEALRLLLQLLCMRL